MIRKSKEVFRRFKRIRSGSRLGAWNPNRILCQSPGLESRAYPGDTAPHTRTNPNGVVSGRYIEKVLASQSATYMISCMNQWNHHSRALRVALPRRGLGFRLPISETRHNPSSHE